MNKKNIQNIIKKRVLILDGATGTQLQKRGMPQGVCPEIWCLKNPGVIESVHADYVSAGADIVYTCTFGANRLKLKQYGQHDPALINQRLVLIARKAVGSKALVAGDIGPTGKFIEPFGRLSFEDAVNIFKEQARGLLRAGVDLFVIETMIDIQEARAALIAVKEVTDAFTIVTLTFEENGRTLNGTDAVTALITLQSLGADAVGCNCSSGPQQMLDLIKKMKPYAKVPLVAKPNAGMPLLIEGRTVFNMPENRFAFFGKKFLQNGVAFLGGCCGTTPAHIKALYGQVFGIRAVAPRLEAVSALSSASAHVIINAKKDLVVVGECINPTGKKKLQQELHQGKTAIARLLAREQEAKGARLLDVNVAASGVDEEKMLKKIISLLSVTSKIPLVIDSSNPYAIETALRIYPGRALINSISGESKKMKELLPIAAKYGAMFILLPLNEKGVPKTFIARKKIVKNLFKKAQGFGFRKEDIVIDGLVLTLSSSPRSAIETMKTIYWAAHSFNANTICGLSNISFGMPLRPLINITYRSLLKKQGLSMIIDNPLQDKVLYNKKAESVLLGRDKDASRYIDYCKKMSNKKVSTELVKSKIKQDEKPEIFTAIVEGNRDEIKLKIKKALAEGINPEHIVHEIMIPAINKAGDLFDKKEYFLPQLIASAQTMKIAFGALEPYLKTSKGKSDKKKVVILATVQGDIHDIGKNIVALLLKNHGFSVVDLGKDVGAGRIIREIKKYNAPIVGLSALMTTTMVNMKEVVQLAKKEGLKCRFMAGGAVVTKSYASSLGAEYAANGVDAVRAVKRLIRQC